MVPEIQSLNIDNLDVQELEQRIELASAMTTEMGIWCDCNGECSGLIILPPAEA